MSEHKTMEFSAKDTEYVQRLVEALAPDLAASREREATMRAALKDFVVCFETFNGPLGKSIQGWDYPRLHRAREKALALLGDETCASSSK